MPQPQRARPNIPAELQAEMDEDKQHFSSGDNAPRWKIPEDGKPHYFRILPGNFGKSKLKFYVAQCQHWISGGKGRRAFDCPAKGFGDPCPFCDGLEEYRDKEKLLKDEMRTQPSKECQDELHKVQAIIKNCLYRINYNLNVVTRDDQTPTVRVLSAPKSIYSVIESYFANEGEAIYDGYEGFDFVVTRTKDKGFTKYDTRIDVRPGPLADNDAEIEDLLASIHDLEALVSYAEHADMQKAFEDMVNAVLRGDAGQRDLGETANEDLDHSHLRNQRGGSAQRQPPQPRQAPQPRPATRQQAAPPPARRPAPRQAAPPDPEPDPDPGEPDAPQGDDVPMEHDETGAAVDPEPEPQPVRTTRQAAPAQRQAAPAQRQAAPAQRQAAPAQRQAAPAQRTAAAPAQRTAAAPAQRQAAPAQRQAAPAQRTAAPAARRSVLPPAEEPQPGDEGFVEGAEAGEAADLGAEDAAPRPALLERLRKMNSEETEAELN